MPDTWFDRYVWRRNRPESVEQRAIVDLPWEAGGAAPSASRVTFDRAVAFHAVFAAWRYLADQTATLPLHAYRDLGDRRQRMATLPQLFQQPSVQGTLVDWIHRAVISLLSRGNAVGMVTARDGFGFPTGVEWLNMADVYCDDGTGSRSPTGQAGSFARPVWYYQGREVPRDSILHIPWFPIPGRVLGLSPMAAYATTVQAGLGAQEYARDQYGLGQPPGTYQNTAMVLEQEVAERVKARLVNAIRARQPIVYGKDWIYSPLSINPFEAQFIESQKLGATQIAAIYGVPPEKIGGEAGGSLTYNTVELNQIAAQTDAVRPLVTRLEAAFAKWLPERQYVKFNLDAPIRTDLKTRYEVHLLARQMGLRNVDELRELEDLDPIPNGQGGSFVPLPLLEKGIGSVPKPGDTPTPPAPRPTAEPDESQPPRLRPVAGEG